MKAEYQDIADDCILNGSSVDEILEGMDQTEAVDFSKQVEFTRMVADELTEREHKLARMREWDVCDKKLRLVRTVRWVVSAASVAAVLFVGLFVFSPNHFIPSPAFIEISASARGGIDLEYLSVLINSGQYARALEEIDSESFIDDEKLVNPHSADSDECRYEMQLNRSFFYELRWMKANTLLGDGQIEASRELFYELAHENGRFRVRSRILYQRLKYKKSQK